MEKIWSQGPATVPEQLYADLTIEVAGLADTAARMALRFKISAVIADIAKVERTADALRAATTLAEPKDDSWRAENAFAARVLELHDRLGGFIKP